MKATLEFTLPEETSDHLLAVHASDLHCSLWDFDQYLRGRVRDEEGLSEDVHEALQAARDKLYETMADHNVSLDMVP